MRADWSPEESETADEFIAHARAIRAEQEEERGRNRSWLNC